MIQSCLGILALMLALPAFAQLPLCRSEVGGHCVVVDTKNQGESDRVILRELAQTSGVPIPGLEFLDVTTASSPGDLFRQIFIFGINIVGISALVVIVAAAIWYITAGDNKGKIDQARGWMKNAILGLILALLSWLILYTINPDLVATRNLDNLETITPSGGTPSGGAPSGSVPDGSVGENGTCGEYADCKQEGGKTLVCIDGKCVNSAF